MPLKKPNRLVRFMNSRKVVSVFLVVAALGCIAGLGIAYESASSLRDHGVRVGGEVVEVHTEGRDDFVVVRFSEISGREVTADVGNYRWQPEPRVGDHPELIYDPDDPSSNVVDARMGSDFFSVWAFAVGALAAALLVGPTWTGRLDWNKLR